MSTFVYVVGVIGTGIDWQEVCKIGYSRSPEARVKNMQTGSPVAIDLYDAFDCGDEFTARRIEKAAHKWFALAGIHGEWFEIDPAFACRVVYSLCRTPAQSGREYGRIVLNETDYEASMLEAAKEERRLWHEEALIARDTDEGYDDGRWFELLPGAVEA